MAIPPSNSVSDPTLQLELRLDHYYGLIKTVILSRQDPVSGLLPASTAVNAHGNYTDAWVRDNVYSIMAVWGLGVAYRQLDADRGRTMELDGCVVKLMRGLLFAMMRQADKVERFKHTQSPGDALHAKYATRTGNTVVGDYEWGHLQIDATSLFLLMLGQMTASGLNIILTIDEVNFVQNLVYYIGRAYQTPDYGIWERGNKINSGNPELNASSVGMAKAALEALNGLNLFGVRGAQPSVIHVLEDQIARARTTLESLLPWESNSKEVDSALLSIIGFPAFAVGNTELVNLTRQRIIDRLQGRYGCKRFLRDGHQTVLEDVSRLHYESWELKKFEDIESEWPLFFTYLHLDCLFRHDEAGAREYEAKLRSLLVEKDGVELLPELYYVPGPLVAAEKKEPHSQTRVPNENLPLVWAQSLYYLGLMLSEGLLHLGDVDPLNRHHRVGRLREPVVQVVLLAEDEELQFELEAHGIAAQTPAQLAPYQVRQPSELAAAFNYIGQNTKLGLSGRPVRRLRSLATSKIFRIRGELMLFLPAFMDREKFYLTLDERVLVAAIAGDLAYLRRHWREPGRPTLTILITRPMWETGKEALLELVGDFKEGKCGEISVRLGTLAQLAGAASRERIDFLHDFRFVDPPLALAPDRTWHLPTETAASFPLEPSEERKIEWDGNVWGLERRLLASANLFEHVQILQRLAILRGLGHRFAVNGTDLTVADLLDEAYDFAARGDAAKRPYWAIVRRVAGLRGRVDLGLEDAVTDILVRQKEISVGKAYFEAALIKSPLPSAELIKKINDFSRDDVRERVMTQEILIFVGLLIRTQPRLFDNLYTIRVAQLILLLATDLADETGARQDEAYEMLMGLPPSEVQERLRRVLTGTGTAHHALKRQESLPLQSGEVVAPELDQEELVGAIEEPPGGWHKWRERQGALNRLPPRFFPRLWELLHHCQGLVIGEKFERRNRLESAHVLSEMTAGEKNFAMWVENLLNKIEFPDYRQLNLEAIEALFAIIDRAPDLYIQDFITLDILIGHAVRQHWLDQNPDRFHSYEADKAAAWRTFYAAPPVQCAHYVARALQFLTAA